MIEQNLIQPDLEPRFAGPGRWQAIQKILFQGQDRLTMVTQMHEKYGPLVRINARKRPTYFVNDADIIKHILQDNNRNYVKQPVDFAENPLLGNGLLTSEGDFWRRQRRLAQPAFHRQQIDHFARTMADATEKRLNRWDALARLKRPIDLANEMMVLTLDIVTRTLFGNSLTEAEMATISHLLPLILHGTRQYMLRSRWFGAASQQLFGRKYLSQIETLNRIVERLITERKRSGNPGSDLLGMLLGSEDEETGQKMSDQQLRDEVMTLFLAGHETTANLLAWSISLLSQHPNVYRTLEAEIDRQLAGSAPTLGDLRRLPYTEMVLKESMRLFPPAWILPRSPLAADQWYGETIDPGSNILICTYTLHRSKRYWTQPETFDPLRFMENSESHDRFAYIPFGGGPRLCIGRQFALLEATIILTLMMQRFEIQLSPTTPLPVPETAVTLRPKHGVWVEVSPR